MPTIVRGEIRAIAEAYGEPRRTRIEGPPAPVEFRVEDFIVDEDAWVIVTRDGWIERQKSFTDVASIRVRDGDGVGWIHRARARPTLTLFTDRGSACTLRVCDIPLATGHGEPIQKQFAFADREHLVGVVCHDPRCLTAPGAAPAPAEATHDGDPAVSNGDGVQAAPPPPHAIALMAGGKVLRLALAPLADPSTRKGRTVVRLEPARSDDAVVGVEATDGTEAVCLVTRTARVLSFPVAEANVVAGTARGVTAIKINDEDQVLGFALVRGQQPAEIAVRTEQGDTLTVPTTRYPLAARGGRGYALPRCGTLAAVLPAEARPMPASESVGE